MTKSIDTLIEAKRAGLDLGARATLQPYERWRKTDTAAARIRGSRRLHNPTAAAGQ